MPDLDPTSEAPALPPIERLQELFFNAARAGRDDMIPALLQAGVPIESVDQKNHSALILASYNGHLTTTQLLLALGAAPDGPPEGSANTALMGVAFKGYDEIARLLITSGADVNRENGVGQTAVMMAALFGRTSLVDMLVEAGADPFAVDAAGNGCASLARSQGNTSMVAHIEQLAKSV